jgi:hypothetical protein
MTRVAGLLVALAVVALYACGGGDSAPTIAVSPVGTKATTPTPTPEDTGSQTSDVPTPAEPTLDEALVEFASGDHTAVLEPGGVDHIDPRTLVPGTPPACTNFEFDFSWQVVDPYPPDGVDLLWQIDRGSDQVMISTDTSGEQSVGCDDVQVVNNGTSPVSVAIKYKIGGLP